MRRVQLWAGVALIVIGYVWNLVFFGPLAPVGWLGIPPMLLGIVMALGASRGAKRLFLQAAQKDRIVLGRFRRWLRRRQARRTRKADLTSAGGG